MPSCYLRDGEDHHLLEVTERTCDSQEALCLDLQGDNSVLLLFLHDCCDSLSVVAAFPMVLPEYLTETLERGQICFGSWFEGERCDGGGVRTAVM